ncbi:YciI family protein [Nonomuraea sp. CA-218870]|uniref:YciI family protein n=1 Tax=Nonomuraea corallina TaxID=2989783 RepID=A0ABT4S5L1_9ACTN|nr:YciI family protein [Nonomuraea corallina]MDA0632231.1 YciI family protein [Nonomuraea corallina]
MKYAMLIFGDDREWDALSPAEEQDLMSQIHEWYERWQPTGKIVDGGAELRPRDTAKTVRAGADGRPMIIDGPYLELKEVIGAVVMLECDHLDEAGRIAATWPLAAGMSAVEVRPVMSRDQ